MLASVNGYIDGNRIVTDETISEWQGRNVIVTILDSSRQSSTPVAHTGGEAEKRRIAAVNLAGLWKDQEDSLSVEETIRNMRKGRSRLCNKED